MGAGETHRKLQEGFRVRVRNTLLALFREGEIERERILRFYVYLHHDPILRKAQLEHQRALFDAEEGASVELQVDERIVIQILLVLLSHLGVAADVVRYLRGHSPPPASIAEVRIVFTLYELDNLDKERGGRRQWAERLRL